MRHHRYGSGTFRKAVLLVMLLPSSSVVSRAELPPDVYKWRQQQAPESLIIRVRSLKTSETDEPQRTKIDVRVEAQVQRVNRSKTGLKPGALIRISYVHSRDKEPREGPSEVPILRRGQVYPAYLTKSGRGKGYAPAAGGNSFSESSE